MERRKDQHLQKRMADGGEKTIPSGEGCRYDLFFPQRTTFESRPTAEL